MLEIMSYLMCVYLVFKGLEIFQLSLVNPNENRKAADRIGTGALMASMLLAALFFFWIGSHLKESSRSQLESQKQIQEMLNR